jgi:hypothetical protein
MMLHQRAQGCETFVLTWGERVSLLIGGLAALAQRDHEAMRALGKLGTDGSIGRQLEVRPINPDSIDLSVLLEQT